MDFAFVEGGSFKMGSDHRSSEQPVHTVTVADMFVGMYEVTFNQYDQFCDTTNREKPGDEGWGRGARPAINVTWDDANDFADWLSKKTGYSFRLPTEAEWEYFARAGSSTTYWTGDTIPPNSANCYDCGSKWDSKMTAPVGSFEPNPWGVYDTMGNVVEWVADNYQGNYNGAPIDGTAMIIDGNTRRGQRGGAFESPKKYLRSAARDQRSYDARKNDQGFRLVLEPQEGLLSPQQK
jgi:formylglycine-generating enzyme required for sulfatase activity